MLELLLQEEIKKKGPLSQSRFMELALQHPLHGYYRTHQAVSQDFTTSPEISQVFGELIGAWVIDYFIKRNQPKTLSLIELGPGKGTLVADLLRVSRTSKSFSEAVKIHLVEINPFLKALQLEAINSCATWVDHLSYIPLSSDPVVIIANEFFDALPTSCYVLKDNILYERCIEIKGGKLAFTLLALGENNGPDQIWEESPESEILMKEICARLLKQSGVFLCIDYGYEEGKGDSLQALFKGKKSDPLSHVGKSDLTCHVHFGRLKEIAHSQGLEVLGPTPQGQFLKNLGLDIRLEILKNKNPSQKTTLEVASARLTHPQQMGTLYKVMAVFSPPSIKPAGF